MCQRMCPLSFEEAQEVLASREETGRARVAADETFDSERDAWPGSMVAAFVPDEGGKLVATKLTWGFDAPSGSRAVFNTRIETALAQLRDGRGMWADAIAHGRCLVPVRAFYESHATERVKSERTGRPVRRQYRFLMPGAKAFLLAGVCQDGKLSIVTCEPNSAVAPVHNRMPLVLGPGESAVWLGPGFEVLADRSRVRLVSEPER
ncbi:SOS response-associated peptidase family protein [Collinsella tanakaei]|nr:SOS response-associated peptidase family protein [Collinsella tanakaei]